MWISYTALGASVFAAVVSAISARTAYLAFQMSGPRLQFLVETLTPDPPNSRYIAKVKVVNRGRGEVDIAGFYITSYGHRKPILRITEIVAGHPLPHRIMGGSEEVWHLDLLPTARRYVAGLQDRSIRPWSSWPEQVYLTAKGANGNLAHAKRPQLSTRQLIIDTLPAGGG